jgi:hypothetical protein
MFLVEEIAKVSVTDMAKWIKAIPFEDWPQQRPLDDGQLRPSMVTNTDWHGFGEKISFLMEILTPESFIYYQPMLSVVMPGHSIEPHKDQQPDHWKYRVHIPLQTNTKAFLIMKKEKFNLKVGKAYKVNVRETHSIVNNGKTPRIHFMFDVK